MKRAPRQTKRERKAVLPAALAEADRARLELAMARADRVDALMRAHALEGEKLEAERAACEARCRELMAELGARYRLGGGVELDWMTGAIKRPEAGAPEARTAESGD